MGIASRGMGSTMGMGSTIGMGSNTRIVSTMGTGSKWCTHVENIVNVVI